MFALHSHRPHRTRTTTWSDNASTGNLDDMSLHDSTALASTALATGGSIANGFPAIIVTPTAAVTGVIIPVGGSTGQMLTVINNTAFTITFAAVATSHVADGTLDVIIANSARDFIWSGAAWFKRT
jgi:hypothetical protein